MEKNEYMDMKKIVNIILSKKIFIILILLISLVMGYFYSYYYKKPQYNSSVTILLTGDEAQGEKQVTQTDLNLNSGLISTYGSIAKSANVLSKVIENLELDISVQNLQKSVTVAEIKNTQFIKITVENSNPESAMKIANEIANVFVGQIEKIYNIQNVNIVDLAEIPDTPCNINHIKDLSMAFIVGLFVSGILILIIYILDDTIKTEKDIPVNLKLETIGIIPNTNKTNNELIIETDPKSYIVECLKTIRTNILYSSNINKKKVILFTSAREKEGKSFIVNNIAVTFAQANKKVILVDTNLRNPQDRSQIFENKKGEGLSDFIKEISEDKLKNLEKASQYIRETKITNLHILESGTIPPNPSELLASKNMKNLLDLLKSMYDIVLLDGTPSMIVSDSIALSTMVDSTILVAENKETKISELKKTKRQIQDVGGKIMGVILNKTDIQRNKYYGKGYGYYYGEEKQDKNEQIKEIQVNQPVITVSKIIENAKPIIEQELLNREIEQELGNNQVVEEKQEEKTEKKENGFKNVINKIFNKISNIEKRLDNDDSMEKINNIFIEIENIKNKHSLDKQEMEKSRLLDKQEILEDINNLKDGTRVMQNYIEDLQISNNNVLDNIGKLDLEKENILEKVNILNTEQNNLKELQQQNKQEMEKSRLLDKQEILENINNLKDGTRVMQNYIEDLQISNSNILDNIGKLDLEKENILEKVNILNTEQNNLKELQQQNKQEMEKSRLSDKQEILENINNLKDETRVMQNYIEDLQISNSNILDNIGKLDLEKENILAQISNLRDNNSDMFENIDELMNNKEIMEDKINNFYEKIEELKNEQLKAKADIENTVKEIQKIEVLRQKTKNMEQEFNVLETLKAKIELANKEIELLRQLQNEQINNIDYKISNLKELQLNSNKDLLEKISAINYDDKLIEINENILKSKNEYAKMLEEINKNKQEEKPNNIISFESLKKKKKLNKKVFSINENIMSEDLENSSSYIVDLNKETFGVIENYN